MAHRRGGQTAKVIANPQGQVLADRRGASGTGGAFTEAGPGSLAETGECATDSSRFRLKRKKLEEDIRADIKILTAHFPNLKQVFLSNRIYAGYASTPLNPEPHAYETAFADKWLISEQIAGKSDLTPWLTGVHRTDGAGWDEGS